MDLSGKLEIESINDKLLIKEDIFCAVGEFYKDLNQRTLFESEDAKSTLTGLVHTGYTPTEIIKGVKLCKFSGMRNGQPYIKVFFDNAHRIYNASISHSKQQLGIVILDNGLIGLDIEEVKDINKNIIERLFSEYDLECIEKVYSTNKDISWHKAFTLVWTIKESFLKALGIGFRYGINSVVVRDIDFNSRRIELTVAEKVVDKIHSIPNQLFMYISLKTKSIITIAVII